MKLDLPPGTKVFIPPAVTFWQWFVHRYVLGGGWYVVTDEGGLSRISERHPK